MAEYIDRTLLLSDIDAAMNNDGMGYVIGQTLKRYVKRQPSADVAPVVHGRWDCCDSDFEDTVRAECSICGMVVIADDYCSIDYMYHYCPNCGAKMDLEVYDG